MNPIPLADVEASLAGKRVLVVGNAESKRPPDDLQVDHTIALNRGVQFHPSADMVALSWEFPRIRDMVEGKLVLWRQLQPPTDRLLGVAWARLPEGLRVNLATALGNSRPSIGCQVVNWLVRKVAFSELLVYGFDHWQTKTNYSRGGPHPGPHSPEAERDWFARVAKRPGVYVEGHG